MERHQTGIGGIAGIDTDGNGNGRSDLYAGDLQGNVYVFDVSSSKHCVAGGLKKHYSKRAIHFF